MLPKCAFEKIGINIAEYGTNYFLIIYDFYSRWLEILKIKDKSIDSIIFTLKPIFIRFVMYCVYDNVSFNSNVMLFTRDSY